MVCFITRTRDLAFGKTAVSLAATEHTSWYAKYPEEEELSFIWIYYDKQGVCMDLAKAEHTNAFMSAV